LLGGYNCVDCFGELVEEAADVAFVVFNTVELHADMFGKVFSQFGRDADQSVRENAFGEVSFMSVELAGNTRSQVKYGSLILYPSVNR
jgi:hypothetical protein